MEIKKSVTAADKKKKKVWIPILASKEFRNVDIGETYVEVPASCIGRFVEANLMVLTGDPKKQTNNVRFRINEFKDNVLHTELVGFHIQTAQLKRLTRKQKDKVEDSFVCNTKDGVKVRVKPSMVVKSKFSNSKLTLLRKSAQLFISGQASRMTYSQFMMDVVDNVLQKSVRGQMTKVVPIANCIIKAALREA